MTSPFSWIGIKNKEIDKIHGNEPDEFSLVADLFGGSGCVGLSYAKRGFKVIYNDIDKNPVDVLRAIKNGTLGEHLEEYKLFPVTKETYADGLKDVPHILFRLAHGYRGHIHSSMMRMVKNKDGVNVYCDKSNFMSGWSDWIEPMQNVHIMNDDAVAIFNVLKKHENVFVYIDPPYMEKGIANPYSEISIDACKVFIDAITDPNVKCKIMLHINFCGYTYDKLKNNMRAYYPINYRIARRAGKDYYTRYSMIATNY
jgi:site-specific DNA-adenine methylase